MSSIIEGYSYDIFVSYRQKDNKGDRWVSEFVEALKTELESTFKEEISVYFDINPHDGLLETHDVDASLKEKLKCLVFVPIISRTYCDPKSFAWEHEFKAFIEQASKDQFGLKVKLPNGNVANRVLPVRIHDLDNADIKECESVLGGVLRGVDFIYKESGIDKPLASDDDEKKNLNNTKYRIQIIKVAHAIKEIILGMKKGPIQVVKDKDQTKESNIGFREDEIKSEPEEHAKSGKRKLISIVAIIAILIIPAILAYPKLFKRNTLEKLRSSGERISVAVMPFQNMTNDTTLNVWQDGIQDMLITSLSNSEELKVRQRESVTSIFQSKGFNNYASITPSVASTVSKKLEANVFIYGSIKQVSGIMCVNAELIDSKTEEVFKSFQIDGNSEKILTTTDSLSTMIKNFLIISKLGKEVSPDLRNLLSTNSPVAYKYFIYGDNAFRKGDYPTAIKLFSQACDVDSNFILATLMLSMAYGNQQLNDQAKKWILKIYEKRDQMPIKLKILTTWVYAWYFETPYEENKYLRQLLEIDDQLPDVYYQLGNNYIGLTQYDKAIPEFEKALEIYNRWSSKPRAILNYTLLGYAYFKTGQYNKAKEIYKKAERDFPPIYPNLILQQAYLSLAEGDTIETNRYIDKYSSLELTSWSEARRQNMRAKIYSEVGIFDKAEKYYRQALSLEPENPIRMNNLARLLINSDRNITEGLELVDKALKKNPNNYSYYDCKGWGLYKLGKYEEAIKILEKSLELKSTYFDYEINLHLEAAKKAVANQK
jgi:tetratricopeptide (TPR) repeat protein